MNLSSSVSAQSYIPAVGLGIINETPMVEALTRNRSAIERDFLSGKVEGDDTLPVNSQQEFIEIRSAMLAGVFFLGDETSLQKALLAFSDLSKIGYGSFNLRLKNYPDVVYQITLSRKDKEVLVSTKRCVN